MKPLTSGQVAKMLRCAIPTVHKIPASRLPYTMVGTHRRYDEADVRRYMKRQRYTGEPADE